MKVRELFESLATSVVPCTNITGAQRRFWREDFAFVLDRIKRGEDYVSAGSKVYKVTGPVKGGKISTGDKVMAVTAGNFQSVEIYLVRGYTTDGIRDDALPEYKTIAAACADLIPAVKVPSLKALQEAKIDLHMIVKDLHDGQFGPFFYIYKNRWCSGSGANALSFFSVEEVTE